MFRVRWGDHHCGVPTSSLSSGQRDIMSMVRSYGTYFIQTVAGRYVPGRGRKQ